MGVTCCVREDYVTSNGVYLRDFKSPPDHHGFFTYYSQQNTVKLPTSTRRRNQAPEFTVLVFESFGRKVNLDEIQSHPKRVIYSCHCCAEIEVSTVVFPTCHVSESC